MVEALAACCVLDGLFLVSCMPACMEWCRPTVGRVGSCALVGRVCTHLQGLAAGCLLLVARATASCVLSKPGLAACHYTNVCRQHLHMCLSCCFVVCCSSSRQGPWPGAAERPSRQGASSAAEDSRGAGAGSTAGGDGTVAGLAAGQSHCYLVSWACSTAATAEAAAACMHGW